MQLLQHSHGDLSITNESSKKSYDSGIANSDDADLR